MIEYLNINNLIIDEVCFIIAYNSGMIGLGFVETRPISF